MSCKGFIRLQAGREPACGVRSQSKLAYATIRLSKSERERKALPDLIIARATKEFGAQEACKPRKWLKAWDGLFFPGLGTAPFESEHQCQARNNQTGGFRNTRAGEEKGIHQIRGIVVAQVVAPGNEGAEELVPH